MTPEQLEKAIQFFLEQQAVLDAAFHRDRKAAKEDRQQTEARFRDLAEKLEQTRAITERNAQQIERNSQHIANNSDQIEMLGEQIKSLKDACRDLLEHSTYTDFRLNRLERPENS